MKYLHKDCISQLMQVTVSTSKISLIGLKVRVTVVLVDIPPLDSSKMSPRKWGYFMTTNWNLSLPIILSHRFNHMVVCCVGVRLFSIMLFFPIRKQGVCALSVSLTLSKIFRIIKHGKGSFLLPWGTENLGLTFFCGQLSSLW